MADFAGPELKTMITSDGELRLWLERGEVRAPVADEVVVEVQASPINPSDIGVLLGPADLATLSSAGEGSERVLTASVPRERLADVAGRLDQPLPAGNEGGGVIVAAGAAARSLIGRAVGVRTPGMYSRYRTAKLGELLVLPEGAAARDGAAWFVNPMTALGMTETLRLEGHSALVHTAAASNLGRMLIRLCRADGIPLVNVVRSPAQVELLRSLDAEHVVDSSAPSFAADLDAAIEATGATLGFDAIGGGPLAGAILAGMERALARRPGAYSRYGSPVLKQVYLYGMLDTGPTEIERTFGMAWSVGGWLLPWFLERIGAEGAQRMKDRVLADLTTVFASRYSAEIPLGEMLSADTIRAVARRATGEKYLVNPGLHR